MHEMRWVESGYISSSRLTLHSLHTFLRGISTVRAGYGDFMHVLNLSELARRRAISRLLRLTSHSPTALFCMTEIETKS